MIIGEWQAKLYEHPGVHGAELYIFRRMPNCREFLTGDGEVRTITEDYAKVGSDLSFAQLSPEQIQALADAFNNYGVKTPNDHKLAGLLEAKDAHLQDMRSLVFKGKEK